MERNTIHFLSFSSGARFALASYNSNLGPLGMKLSHVNFNLFANMAASVSQCSRPLGTGGKQELAGKTILGIRRLWVNGMMHNTLSLSFFWGSVCLSFYNRNLGPLDMKLSHVNFDLFAIVAASDGQCSHPSELSGKSMTKTNHQLIYLSLYLEIGASGWLDFVYTLTFCFTE